MLEGSAQADTIRLKGGKTVTGDIIREDSVQVVVMVDNMPQAFSRDDVEAISRRGPRLVLPTTPAPALTPADHAPSDVGTKLTNHVRERLRAPQGLLARGKRIALWLRQRNIEAAAGEIRQAADGVLPVYQDSFSPFSALADLIMLLGLQAPCLWLSLRLAREPRELIRIVEFLVPAYGFVMLVMAWAVSATALWVELLAIPLALGGIAWLFAWMFEIAPGKTLFALLLAIGMAAGLEWVLLQTHLV